MKRLRCLPVLLLITALVLTACSGSPPDEKSLQAIKDKVEGNEQEDETAGQEEEPDGESEDADSSGADETADGAETEEAPVQEPEIPEKITCPTCKGAGQNFCTIYEGKGKVEGTQFVPGYKCTYCKGTGYSSCWTCGGTGQADNPEYSAQMGTQDGQAGSAGGSGNRVSPDFSYDRSPSVCTKCKGAGTVMCTSCKGVGKKYATKSSANYGSGSSSYTETTTCRLCGGSGSAICTLCGGTGEH